MSKKATHGAGGAGHADMHEDEMHVTRTTPQGTQEAGVEKGYELRDVLIRPTLNWFIGLMIGTIITIGAMWLLMVMLAGADRVQKDAVSSPLYVVEHTRRVPELLPNPAQGKRQKMPWDHMDDFRQEETKVLHEHGLSDVNGRPTLPLNAVRMVESEPARGRTGEQMMPSDATGGTSNAISILTR